MAAPKGNEFWKARSSHGIKPKFSDPDVLWNACEQYFQWVVDNPLWEQKLFHNQGEIVEGTLYKMRAMTLSAMQIFIDVSHTTWETYRKKNDLLSVTTRVDEIIRNQKFEGAAADLLNANIIARDLGLSDKQEIKSENTNTDRVTINFSKKKKK